VGEIDRCRGVAVGERDDVVDGEWLWVSGPPAEEVMDVDDETAWGAGVQPRDDGVSERLPVRLKGLVGPR